MLLSLGELQGTIGGLSYKHLSWNQGNVCCMHVLFKKEFKKVKKRRLQI